MARFEYLWTDEIVAHLAEHDIRPEDFERIVDAPEFRGISRSTGRPACWGESHDGRWILCVYEMLDELTVLPVTAYTVPDWESLEP